MPTLIYKVQSGESISKIAEKMLGDMERWKELAFINGISHPYIIYPGQILELPDDNQPPAVVEVFGRPEENTGASVTKASLFSRPATVIAIVVGVALLLSKMK